MGDLDLLELAKKGDRSAFDELVGPLINQGYKLAFGMLHSRTAAEDAVQEAALRAWMKLRQLKPGKPIRPWFLGIVANQCRSTVRARWWSIRTVEEGLTLTGSQFEAQIENGTDVRAALRRLSVEQREALVLRYYLDLQLDEIAAITRVPVGTVKSRINRAVAAMKPLFGVVEALI